MPPALIRSTLVLAAILIAGCGGAPVTQAPKDVVLPGAPRASDLVPFFVSAATSNRFMIDAATLDVVPDRDIQFTLVVEADGGARTVTREAIRCGTAEYRILAVARRDGTWSRLADPQWHPIENTGPNRHRGALATEYLCDGSTSVIDAETALEALRNPSRFRHGLRSTP